MSTESDDEKAVVAMAAAAVLAAVVDQVSLKVLKGFSNGLSASNQQQSIIWRE